MATSRIVAPFAAVKASDGFLVDILRGNRQEVVVEAPEGFQDLIYTSVVEGELRIELDRSIDPRDLPRKRVFIVVPYLNSVTAHSGAAIYGVGIWDAPQFYVDVDGGSYAEVNVGTNLLNLWASGGSEVKLTGEVQQLYADEISGNSHVYAYRLLTGQATLNLSGSSYVETTCVGLLNVSASGGSTVKYLGYPQVIHSLTGGSQVIDAN